MMKSNFSVYGILVLAIIGIVLISGCVQQKPAEEGILPTEKPSEVPTEEVTPEKQVKKPELAEKYCPLDNLLEGWSVENIYPVDLSPSEYLKINNIIPKRAQTVDYSIVGEKARRLCQVFEYKTVDEAKEIFNIKKSEMAKAGVYKPFKVGDEAFKAGGWVWIRVDRFLIQAWETLSPMITEKVASIT